MWRTSIAVLLAGLALAACGSSQSTSSTSTARSGTTPKAPTSTAQAPCAASQLRLSYVGTEGATGHLEVTLALHNTSARPCTLRGYPSARLLDKGGAALPLTIKRGGGFFPDTQRRAGPVVLKPGGRARFGVSFITNNEFAGAHVCRTAAAAMSSAPGAAGHWWRLSLRGAPRISPCGNQLVVSPVYA
jgi:Protein of unknown function (DUF4232)